MVQYDASMAFPRPVNGRPLSACLISSGLQRFRSNQMWPCLVWQAVHDICVNGTEYDASMESIIDVSIPPSPCLYKLLPHHSGVEADFHCPDDPKVPVVPRSHLEIPLGVRSNSYTRRPSSKSNVE